VWRGLPYFAGWVMNGSVYNELVVIADHTFTAHNAVIIVR